MPDDHEHRLSRIERAMFGFRDDESNVWVDGLLQEMADQKRSLRLIVPIAAVGSISVFGSMLHSYGALEALAKLITKAFNL